MGSLERRIGRLEQETLAARQEYEDWPLVNQIEDAFCYVKLHASFGSVAACTDRQLRCLGLLAASWENPDIPLGELSPLDLEHFPAEVREHISRLNADMQPERDAWLRQEAGHFVRELEGMPARLAEIEARQRVRAEESRRKDRELIERNRALVGLPPLEGEE